MIIIYSGGSMSRFEKKFGKYAISNLTTILIICYVVGYVLEMINANFFEMLTLNPLAIMQGQVWRLVTWIVIPPEQLDIFTIIMLYFYYSVGKTLERAWGDYKYNIYIFSGLLFTVIASFACYGICEYLYGPFLSALHLSDMTYMAGSTLFSTYFINMSIFLAFAATFPNAQVLLMFVVPVRIKWMGIIYAVLLGAQFISAVTAIEPLMSDMSTGAISLLDSVTVVTNVCNIAYCGAILASLVTFGVFWLINIRRFRMSPKQMKRRHEFKQEVKVNSKITKHKCAICGQTDETNENLSFRFCSKCNGNYEYCQEHLFTHEHVK